MGDFNVEDMDRRFPMYVHIQNTGGFDFNNYYGAAERIAPPSFTEFKMHFTIPDTLDLVEGVALMYYQFDKFMKERYGAYVQKYQEQQRARRIDKPQTEPGTDTGENEQ